MDLVTFSAGIKDVRRTHAEDHLVEWEPDGTFTTSDPGVIATLEGLGFGKTQPGTVATRLKTDP